MEGASDWRRAIDALSARYGLSPGASSRLASLLELVRDDDEAPTTVRDPAAGVAAHLADSLTALDLDVVRDARRLADLGAGAGFPALPLACALPDATVFAVESVARKCAFLRLAVERCALHNVVVVCERAETWPERHLDVVCARAVAPLAPLVEYAAPLLRLGGSFVAYKGRRDAAEEEAGSRAGLALGLEPAGVHAVAPTPAAEHRHLHTFVKVADTPSGFPRRAGMARKRPLGG